jgi:hypothetical protein
LFVKLGTTIRSQAIFVFQSTAEDCATNDRWVARCDIGGTPKWKRHFNGCAQRSFISKKYCRALLSVCDRFLNSFKVNDDDFPSSNCPFQKYELGTISVLTRRTFTESPPQKYDEKSTTALLVHNCVVLISATQQGNWFRWRVKERRQSLETTAQIAKTSIEVGKVLEESDRTQ